MEEDLDIMIRRPNTEDQASAYRMFTASITDAFAQEGLADAAEDIAYEIAHKSDLLRAAIEQSSSASRSPGVPPAAFFLIAEREGEVMGTVSFGPRGEKIQELAGEELNGVGELGSLYVHPNAQNQGIGSKLIAAMVNEIRNRGVETFCLDSGYGKAQERWRRKFGEPHVFAKDYWDVDAHHVIWFCRVKDHE